MASRLLLCIAALSFSTIPALASLSAPIGTKLYVIWGHSEAGGHDSSGLDTALKLLHGDKIWALKIWKDGRLDQTQNPPPNTFASRGPSPSSYFADQLISDGKAASVAVMKCPGGGDNWRVGIKGKLDTLTKCVERVKRALDLGYELSGGLTFCCAGDAIEEGKARSFADNYKELLTAFRAAMGQPQLPFVSAMTPLTQSCNKSAEAVELIKLLRAEQAALQAPNAIWVDVPAAGLPKSCFHLKGEEQAQLGRVMAQAMPGGSE